ncbi:hypothetical protein HYC85_027584 [Camellia sinensis]|uniref:Uncharacterized protein n=1 Tax=Camellia sinensis TaxID=4442 RepID=A0A7J7G839_CAMSI|nr:hypothetical protein HYC85_027584 [Camellia sinensis]
MLFGNLGLLYLGEKLQILRTFGIRNCSVQPRVVPMEEGKDPTVTARTTQSRVFPQRLLHIYMILYFGVNTATALPSFQPCVVEEPTSLEQWIKPPSNLLRKMTDKELFWRASFTSVSKIAFMFLTKGPLPLAPLWERFLKGHEGLYLIYIHSLPSFQVDFPSSSVFYRRQIPSQRREVLGEEEEFLRESGFLSLIPRDRTDLDLCLDPDDPRTK